MYRVHLEKPEVDGKCSPGYAQGQDVTIDYAEGVTIAHNIFRDAAWHYLQGGGAGPEGVTVEHNLFAGHQLLKCAHLNLWQIFAGGDDDTFKDNIAIGEGTGETATGTEEAATDGLIFENGSGSSECAVKIRNTVVENNLFYEAADSYAIQLYTTDRAVIKNNTVVKAQYGTGLLVQGCGASTHSEMTHNINVESTSRSSDFAFQCAGACLFDHNVSGDASASRFGALHFEAHWQPAWLSTAWNPRTESKPPAGYYVPTDLPFLAGYRGGGGP
jgi:hypothetical protein